MWRVDHRLRAHGVEALVDQQPGLLVGGVTRSQHQAVDALGEVGEPSPSARRARLGGSRGGPGGGLGAAQRGEGVEVGQHRVVERQR
ncbi:MULTISPECIES: hypothetical protein [Saccharothrix]|uniref:hypothetical protein n=1 Tax=Saccharothrix TaxID=2071 RepID=UPI000939EEAB|nr:hypothetical protein [Saccharothrix sp. CB00851]OKI18653.1 hypothetical protein A6A25_39555 [Saccharothrix sp. CB00851]